MQESVPSSVFKTPCNHKENGRNLIVCIDGTSNQFGENNTNVIKLFNFVHKGPRDNQRAWYNCGIGAYAAPPWKTLEHYKHVLGHKIDLAVAWNFERILLGAYRWLSDNYEDGDCIFLFGFSRGAFQVRALSAMIEKVGLIHRGSEMQIPFAYELYASPRGDEPSNSIQRGLRGLPLITMAQEFKNTFSHKDVKVHFVGAWDTVSSIGIERGTGILPGTVDGMKHVCYFRHALALDERRVKFQPEYAYGGRAAENESQCASNKDNQLVPDLKTELDDPLQPDNKYAIERLRHPRPQTLEVWFAGTHSDVGGGNIQSREGMDLSRPPLRWMLFEAQSAGLRVASFDHDHSDGEQVAITESLAWYWWPLEMLPIKQLSYTDQEDEHHLFTYKPHLGTTRTIHAGQKIHGSLLTVYGAYVPRAHPVGDDTSFWTRLREDQPFRRKWVESELVEYAANAMDKFIFEPDEASKTLRRIARSVEGRQAVYEQAIEALKHLPLDQETKYRILHLSMDITTRSPQGSSSLELKPTSLVLPLLADLLESENEEHQKAANEFISRFTGQQTSEEASNKRPSGSRLEVTILRAVNLPHRIIEFLKERSFYVTLTSGTTKKNTMAIHSDNHEVEWNEKLDAFVLPSSRVTVSLYAKRRLHEDRLIGNFDIPLQSQQDTPFRLRSIDHTPPVTLHLTINLAPVN